MPRVKEGSENKEADNWLSAVMFRSEGGTDAVCAVCKQHVESNNDIYPICTNCNNLPNLSNYEY